MVCLLTLILIKKIIGIYHNISFFNRKEFTRPNINALIEKLMPWFWICVEIKGNEKYCYEKIVLEIFWSSLLLPNLHEKKFTLKTIEEMVVKKRQ